MSLTVFQMGWYYGLGYAAYLREQQSILALDEDVIFRKTKNNQTIAIKNGKIVGGAGKVVGPDGLPSFDYFVQSDPDLKNASYTKKVTAYLKANYAGCVIEKPAGLKGCDKLIFTNAGLKETAAHMGKDKEKVLSYLAYIYRTGKEVGKAEDYHRKSTATIHYTQKILKIENQFWKVTLVSKQAGNNVAEFSHYVIDKADEVIRKEKG